MHYLIILIFLLTPSCSLISVEPKTTVEHRGESIPGSVYPHVLAFEEVCETKVRIPIHFSDKLSENVIGVCVGFGMPTWIRTVMIDKEWWDGWESNESIREELVFHELGHCILDLDDTNEYIYDHFSIRRPSSIMHYQSFGYYGYYEENREMYVEELCGKKKVDTK